MAIDELADEPCPDCGFDEWLIGYEVYNDEGIEVNVFYCFNCGFNSMVKNGKAVNRGE